ncbi:MAG: hypothetical protein GXN93_05330 [Candidatus Diapherotrites archaeon]|nr:hypothetical protein [Candidatus Diapherotrites archaeon]
MSQSGERITLKCGSVACVFLGRVPESLLAIVDLDGVIVDPSRRLAMAREECGDDRACFWNKFLDPEAALKLDKPNPAAIEYVSGLPYGIVIVTGRPENMLEATLKQLDDYGVRYDAIFFRADYTPAHKYKRAVVERLVEEGAEIVEVHDDNEKVLEELRNLIPSARLVLWTGSGYTFYNYGSAQSRTRAIRWSV